MPAVVTSVRLTPAQERVLRAMARHPHTWRKTVQYQIKPDLYDIQTGMKVHDSTIGGLIYRGLVFRPIVGSYTDDVWPGDTAELTPAGRQWLADHPEES